MIEVHNLHWKIIFRLPYMWFVKQNVTCFSDETWIWRKVQCSFLLRPPHYFLLIIKNTKALNQKFYQLKSSSSACLCTGPCLSVSSIALFCLYYCNHFAGPDLCGCAGSFTTKLHGNRVKVEYLLEEAIWRQAVCTGGLASLVGSPLSL